jgi:hypothetical protein
VKWTGFIAAALLWPAGPLWAAGGPLGIDHEWRLDQSGIWARHYQTGLEIGAVAIELGGAFYYGNDTRIGHTLFQSLDATAISGAAAQGLKYAFGRARPTQGNDPGAWFKGSCCQSFPSGEVTVQASFVTPLILQYRGDHPAIWLLELLPVYDGFARLKSQALWQTDVLAGWALGTGVGLWTAKFKVPLTVALLPHGMTVGFAHRF